MMVIPSIPVTATDCQEKIVIPYNGAAIICDPTDGH
jgi:hypothetical protein